VKKNFLFAMILTSTLSAHADDPGTLDTIITDGRVNGSVNRIRMKGNGNLTLNSTVSRPIEIDVNGNICISGAGTNSIRAITGQGILNLNLVNANEPRIEFSGIVRRTSNCTGS
jgi:hypothetical protein